MTIQGIQIDGQGTFNDVTENAGVVSTAVFAGSASNSGTISLSAEFGDATVNHGTVTTAVFAGSAVNTGTVEKAEFYDGAMNAGTVSVSAKFLDKASNTGTVTTAYFGGSAVNDGGTITGNAILADTASNLGTIQGDVQVAATATQAGTVQGSISEYVPPANYEDIFTDASIDGSFNITPYSFTTHGGKFYQNGIPYTGTHAVTVYIIEREAYGSPTGYHTTQKDINFVDGVVVWYDDNSYQIQDVNLNGAVTQADEGGGVKAAQFDGYSGYLNINSFNFDLSQNSTIEFWMKPSSSGQCAILGNVSQLNVGVDNSQRFFVNNALADSGNNFAKNNNEWAHIAIVTQSGAKYVYHNGVLATTNTQSFANLTSLVIGNLYGYYSGKLAGLRMVAGTALYTSNFSVPTTLPTNVTGTELLMNFGATAAPSV